MPVWQFVTAVKRKAENESGSNELFYGETAGSTLDTLDGSLAGLNPLLLWAAGKAM